VILHWININYVVIFIFSQYNIIEMETKYKVYKVLCTIAVIYVIVYMLKHFVKCTEGMDGSVLGMSNPQLQNPDMTLAIDEENLPGLPSMLEHPWATSDNSYGQVDYLDDGAMGAAGLNFNLCSKSCCAPQYPPPFDVPEDHFVANSKDNFVTNNYTCNNGMQDTGCLCMTKEQANFQNSRGGNSSGSNV
jgi:hypothetical protein